MMFFPWIRFLQASAHAGPEAAERRVDPHDDVESFAAAYRNAPLPAAGLLDLHYPRSLSLVSVQVVTRHGDRSPVGSHVVEATGSAGLWKSCVQNADSAAFGSALSRLSAGTPASALPDLCECATGQLTAKGMSEMHQTGVVLREVYAGRLGLLPRTLGAGDAGEDGAVLRPRSTAVPRAQESLQCLLEGVWPARTHRAPGVDVSPLVSAPPTKERLFVDYKCKSLLAHWEMLADKSKSTEGGESGPQGAGMRGKPQPFYGVGNVALPHPEILSLERDLKGMFGLPEDMKLTTREYPLVYFADLLHCKMAHGLPLPAAFDMATYARLMRVSTRMWFGSFERDADIARLGIGPLVGELVDSCDRAIGARRSPPPPPPQRQQQQQPQTPALSLGLPRQYPLLTVYSGHDTTVGPLTAALGVFDGMWPRTASVVVLELFQERDQQAKAVGGNEAGDYFVRVYYNGSARSLPVPEGPVAWGKNGELGPHFYKYSDFKRMAQRVIPNDHDIECNSPDMFPALVEHAKTKEQKQQ